MAIGETEESPTGDSLRCWAGRRDGKPRVQRALPALKDAMTSISPPRHSSIGQPKWLSFPKCGRRIELPPCDVARPVGDGLVRLGDQPALEGSNAAGSLLVDFSVGIRRLKLIRRRQHRQSPDHAIHVEPVGRTDALLFVRLGQVRAFGEASGTKFAPGAFRFSSMQAVTNGKVQVGRCRASSAATRSPTKSLEGSFPR